MADIVNLRLARKRVARAAKDQISAENRALHGRTGGEKTRDRLVADQTERFLSGHRREPGDKARDKG